MAQAVQPVELSKGWDLPTPHAMHASAALVVSVNRPEPQAVQTMSPAALHWANAYVPAEQFEHALQCVLDVADAKRPFGHVEQEVFPIAAWNVPTEHSRHAWMHNSREF